jgi:hypothetical protein
MIKTETLCFLTILCSVPAMVNAVPVVDGCFDPGEGYNHGAFVILEVEGVGQHTDDGVLRLYQDPLTNDLYVNFIQPLTLIDNTYGKNSIGWGDDALSGKHHNFKDLIGSDSARFTITNGADNIVFDFKFDYISTSYTAPSGYASLGVTGGDGDIYLGIPDQLLDWGTSLDYNFNVLGHVLIQDSPLTDENYTENPSYPGWVFEIIYEFKIDGILFSTNGLGSVSIPIIHASPNKMGGNKVYPTVTSVCAPEPAILTLLGLGVLLLRQRRR